MSSAPFLSTEVLLITAVTVVIGLVGIFIFVSRLSSPSNANNQTHQAIDAHNAAANQINVAHNAPPNGSRRDGQGGRRANANRASASRMGSSLAREMHADSEEELSDDGGFEGEEGSFSQKGVGKKKLARIQQREQEKREKENQEAMREAKKKDDEDRKRRDELRKLEKEKQKEEEEAALEEKRKEIEERERKEYELFRSQFQVVQEGTQEQLTQEEEQGLLNEFIEYIKTTKVVMLEELAARFKLPTQEAIKRLQDLEKMGRISGVMDDRGKFIYITKSEMEAICRFVNLQGRVSVADLVEKSSELIDLASCQKQT